MAEKNSFKSVPSTGKTIQALEARVAMLETVLAEVLRELSQRGVSEVAEAVDGRTFRSPLNGPGNHETRSAWVDYLAFLAGLMPGQENDRPPPLELPRYVSYIGKSPPK